MIVDASVNLSWFFEDEQKPVTEDVLDLLSAYDAAYLGVASRLRMPLASLDAALSKAALKLGLLAPGF